MKKTPEFDPAYRELQQHLDRLPVGFPASAAGTDIKLLRHIFTPLQAKIAACLSHEPRHLDRIVTDTAHLVGDSRTLQNELTAMVRNGGLEIRLIHKKKYYANAPLVVGMYELQVERLTPEFIRDFKAYTSEKPFGISFLSTPRPQMRTIPIGKAVTPALKAADYHRVSHLLDRAAPPFVILPCICRRKKKIQGEDCLKTSRTETCLAMGHVGETLVEMGVGRVIDREEARAIIRMNQDDGLVLQPANTRQVEFICSCCGCCCSMLGLHQDLPRPKDFWAADFRVALDKSLCVGCGKCIGRCQTRALTEPAKPAGPADPAESKKKRPPVLNLSRCIGCGLCIPSCPAKALSLIPSGPQTAPLRDRDALNRALSGGKHPAFRKAGTVAKLAKGMVLTGDLRLLRKN